MYRPPLSRFCQNLAQGWVGVDVTGGFIIILLFVIRTALEDRMRQEKLPGYKEYAGEVRYKLVPGVW